ncbi:hypothetical protein [Nocardioides sp.]|uniref:hypothetical protein n=1 Tax=Nocardioides sp. TaxID=35761 RepID=UPI002C2FB2F2|nr:hypothetical protein [Nocardioides sp.]HSX67773.1 hypothetical protein [Nocardioides sp.]
MILALLALVLVVLAAVCVAGVVLVRRERERTESELARTRAEAAELRAKVEALARAAQVVREPEEFVITRVGEEPDNDDIAPGTAAPQRIDGRLFLDLVARESVVKAAALGHGVRRALAPEVRNRIRFEMKREVKRSRRARKDEYRRVRDEIRARERAAQGSAQRVAG